MSAMGQARRFVDVCGKSALPPIVANLMHRSQRARSANVGPFVGAIEPGTFLNGRAVGIPTCFAFPDVLQIIATQRLGQAATMNEIAIVVLGINYILVMSLPFIFFERRDRTLRLIWWLTAAPFILLPELIVSQLTRLTPGFVGETSGALDVLSVIAVALGAASISLIRSALDTHRLPLAQWHQSQDSPTALVTSGPYARMRHPFYLAYLMMFLAAAACVPGPGTLAALAYAAILLSLTAAREERRLCQSTFGLEYREYMARTGRFLPLLTRSPR